MKASVSSEFIIKDGEVESSSVVLERREDGEWCKLDDRWLAKIFNNRKGITPLTSHSYFGLKVMFRKNGWISSIFSVEGFKEFIEKNPGLGWDMKYMKQDKDDPHLWHHKGIFKNELWFPVIKSEKKARSSRLVCVNTINAALTEGREYKVKGEVDGLLQVVDDEGLLQEFMPSRFKES